MEEPERGLLSCGTSETTVAHDEIVGGETLDGSLECNGKDVIVEGMGSDVYIDGVYVRSSGDEVYDEVGCGDEVKGGEDLSEDVKSVGTETQVDDSKAVEYEEARSENVVVELDSAVSEGEVRDQTVVGSDSCTVVETTPGSIDVVTLEDAARAPDHKLANTSCENQKDRNVIDHGTPGDCNDVTLETLDQHKNMANNLQSDNKILDKGVRVRDSDEIKENLSSNGEQPNGNSKVEDNSDNVQEVVCGTEVAVDKALLNSGEKKSSSVENCNEKEQIIADKDDECVSALDVSDAEQSDVHKVMQIDVENQQGTETINHTAEVKGTLVSIGSEKNLDANAIVEKDTQITDKGSLVLPLLSDGKEKLKDESNTKQNDEERECISEQVGSNGGHEIEEEFNESGQRKPKDGKVVKHALSKHGSSEICHQARYLLPTVKEEGEFSLSDMVWGKVRSHPWWPGQIFDPSDASERAKKHYKKDCFLVAYFGDRTFAWNEASQLKHFRAHFSSIEKQRSSSESFQNAIDCALDEVSRRVEYGLACSCIPEETYNAIKGQSVENTGIRQEISFKHGDDKSLNASSFSPTNLIDYVKTLSELPTGGFDRLELEIAKAQLLAFNRFKGFSCLPEIQHCGGFDKDNSFVDDEQDVSEIIEDATPVVNKDNQGGLGNLKNKKGARQKRKHNFKDTMHPTKKERRSTDLQSGTPDSPDGDCLSDEMVTDNLVSPEDSKKRRAIDPYDDDPGMQDGRKTTSVAKVSNITKSSFKIGDCIRRAASQLTGSPSVVKCSSDQSQKTDGDIDDFSGNGLDVSPPTSEDAENTTEYSSLNDLLSSLQWVAQEPFGQYTFLNATVSFFSDFRNSIVVAADFRKDVLCTDKVGTKRKKPPVAGTPETFEFEDMSDTYWTDRVIDNGNEEKPVQQPAPTPPPQKKRKKDEKPVTAESAKPAQVTRRPYSRKKQTESNHAEVPGKPPGYIDENAPAELVMNFAELNSVPSETNLNKMFRRFGPLKESETEVDRVSSRARVVFKKCMDAEVACSSAKKFNIFGSVLVNYQLNYTPSALFKAPSVDAATQDQEMLLDLSNFDVNMV